MNSNCCKLENCVYILPGAGFLYHIYQSSHLKKERLELEKEIPVCKDFFEGKIHGVGDLSPEQKVKLSSFCKKRNMTDSLGYLGSLARTIFGIFAAVFIHPAFIFLACEGVYHNFYSLCPFRKPTLNYNETDKIITFSTGLQFVMPLKV